jgi:MFS family permease
MQSQDATARLAGGLLLRVTLPFLAGYFVSYVYRASNAILGPTLAAEFGLTAAGLGLLTGVYFLAFALFQLPLGLLLDRFGPRRVNGTLLLVAASGGLWFSLADSPASAIAARALIGLGVSGCLMSSFQAFVLWHPPERIATLNAIAFSAGALGAIAATVPLEMLLRVLHWREAYVGIVATTVAVSLVLFFWVPERTATPKGERFAGQLRGLMALLHDAAFQRIALCIGASQLAAVSLVTLWIATWLRDVGGYSPAEVARGLLALNIAMIVGYIGFGRAADAAARRGRGALPLLLGGVAVASLALGLIALGVTTGALALWWIYVCASTAITLAYAILSRRYPKSMAGRVNTALNVFVFGGVFFGQWGVGLVLNLWPPTAAEGYAPEGYRWGLGVLWLAQFAGLAWLWRGRRLFARPANLPAAVN